MVLDKNEKLCQVLILECKGPGENSWCYLGYENVTSPNIFNLFSGKQVMRIFKSSVVSSSNDLTLNYYTC